MSVTINGMRKTLKGFTIIELLVVIATIGILTTIGVITYTRIQADARDSQRASRVTVITEALEKYYQDNGEYPGCAYITQDAANIKSDVLKGIDTSNLKTPTETTSDNSIICQDITAGSGPDVFAYIGDNSVSCTSGPACLQYTLKYREESTGQIKTVTSRHVTSIASSGNITDLSANAAITTVDLSWTSVDGAVSYNVDRATNSSFTANKSSTTSSTNSITLSGLTTGTTYYFRVQPVANGGGVGNWSNTASAATVSLYAPTITATVNSNTQITVSWPAVAYAVTGYTIQQADDTGFSVNLTSSTQTGTSGTNSKIFSGLATGSTHSYRVRANTASDGSSAWSNVQTKTTVVPVPTGVVATTNSSTQVTVSWDAVSVADTYTVEYSTSASFTSPTSVTGITATSQAITGLSQGTARYFRVYALVGTTPSSPSSSATATTTVNTPGAPGVAASQPGAIRTCAAGYWVKYPSACPNNYYATGWITSASCPAGTSAVYQLRARYNSSSTLYYSGATTVSQWFINAASSGYYTLWSGQYYCNGPNANSAWGPWSGEVRP